jgi:hypothetical protein
MTRRPVEITQTYTPGKNHGRTRRVTVQRIPATEVVYEGVAEPHLSFDVVERVHALVQRSLRSSDQHEQTITYTADGDTSESNVTLGASNSLRI